MFDFVRRNLCIWISLLGGFLALAPNGSCHEHSASFGVRDSTFRPTSNTTSPIELTANNEADRYGRRMLRDAIRITLDLFESSWTLTSRWMSWLDREAMYWKVLDDDDPNTAFVRGLLLAAYLALPPDVDLSDCAKTANCISKH